jgi:exodeoxyribonuclease III
LKILPREKGVPVPWQKDKGMRLDHFLVSPNLSDPLVDGGVDRWARGQENASDHAPSLITLDP